MKAVICRAIVFVLPVTLLTAVLLINTGLFADNKASTPEFPLVFEDDFEDLDSEGWEPSDSKAWSVSEDSANMAYMIVAKSNYNPPVRSPLNISLRKDSEVEDFVFEARMRSTTKEYGHRDMCVVFGYQDPSHFYYVHMATKADDHANSIFLVNAAPRVSIAKTRTDGTSWNDAWHTVRVVRKAESGEIAVYFDDMEKPIMTTVDKTFTHGKIGIGSFDDTGNFDDIKLWGKKHEK